jgi:hypothetical protein
MIPSHTHTDSLTASYFRQVSKPAVEGTVRKRGSRRYELGSWDVRTSGSGLPVIDRDLLKWGKAGPAPWIAGNRRHVEAGSD